MGKYDPLAEYLRHQPEGADRVTLGFREIEEIIGAPLPPHMYRSFRPWTNSRARTEGRAWLSAGWKTTGLDLGGQHITFVRTGGDLLPRRPRRRKAGKAPDTDEYHLLLAVLSKMPPDHTQVALTFDELTVLIRSRSLPDVALEREQWWANHRTTPQGSAWLSAGWVCEKVYLTARMVVFRRQSDCEIDSVLRYVRALLEGPVPVVHPTATELQRWIRLCRQIGWYFQGTVLYEKGGTALQGLTGEDAEAAQEDYAVCKRELSNDLLEQTLSTFRSLFGKSDSDD